MQKKSIISLNIHTGTYQAFLQKIIDFSKAKISSYVCLANVHMTTEAYLNKEFAENVNNATIVAPDGLPLVKSLKLLYGIKQDRIAGLDILPDLFKEIEKYKLGIYIYGTTKEVIEATDKYLKNNYPDISNKHYHSPPFRNLTTHEESLVIEEINRSGAHIVFVVLGCPKQEKWMSSMHGKINACMIGIGGALPVVIGIRKKAPNWMRNSGLEWVYRLVQEPRRLFMRYAISNSLYIVLFCYEIIKNFIPKKLQ